MWLSVTGDLSGFLEENWQTLETISIVSKLHKVETADPEAITSELLPELSILVKSASSEKCERCWLRSETVGENGDHPTICDRCSAVIAQMEI